MNGSTNDIVILGGGLSGLSTGYVLSNAGFSVKVYERDSVVGGLAKTIDKNGFRFDLGGHRFFTQDEQIDAFVRNLMGNELLTVQRSSKIYLRNKYFDYPLKPINAMFGLGIPTTVRILTDYVRQTTKRTIRNREPVSLEDWVVSNFGRTMFNIYFKEYSEKVWGIDCSRISETWVAQRIKGLSLATALKNAFFKFSGKDLATLTDSFLYPSFGIGRLSDRLREEIEKSNNVFTDTIVECVNHSDFRVGSISVRNQGHVLTIPVDECISSIPITKLVSMLNPSPPASILETAAKLRYRDLVIVAIMVDRERVTDQTWIYIPEQKIPFGRIHEPTNWSPAMAPLGKSLLVMEFFSFRGDAVWNMQNDKLVDLTVENLVRLGFINKREVLDSAVVHVPKAYPLFEVGYRKHADDLHDYLGRFSNLHIAGRSGMFRYYNMDVAIRSGIETAEKVIQKSRSVDAVEHGELVLAST
ncbi:MAG TPA: FAD-dependent oxidoreductase [Nitrospirota bacterium]|nr:FAD-dependent oxidoreductase [Nitrospirota bacterium]